jgi:hypothetical protein
MSAATMDADALSTLTPEELEAIKADEYDAGELDAMKKIAASGSDDDDEENDDDEDDDGDPGIADVTASSTDAAQAKVGEAPAAGPGGSQAMPEPAATRYEAKLPADFGEKVQGLADQEQAAWAKFDDGEIDRTELQKQLRDIEQSRSDLNTARIKAEISQEMNEQSAAEQWQKSVNRAMADFAKPENGGIDYRKDTDKAQDLDQFVKMLAAKPENSDKPMDWFLSEAHRRVQALHGVVVASANRSADQLANAKAKRQPPLDAAPKTLAQVPGGDGPGDVAEEYADVAALDGWELEQAIAKMSPTQREKFLRG